MKMKFAHLKEIKQNLEKKIKLSKLNNEKQLLKENLPI